MSGEFDGDFLPPGCTDYEVIRGTVVSVPANVTVVGDPAADDGTGSYLLWDTYATYFSYVKILWDALPDPPAGQQYREVHVRWQEKGYVRDEDVGWLPPLWMWWTYRASGAGEPADTVQGWSSSPWLSYTPWPPPPGATFGWRGVSHAAGLVDYPDVGYTEIPSSWAGEALETKLGTFRTYTDDSNDQWLWAGDIYLVLCTGPGNAPRLRQRQITETAQRQRNPAKGLAVRQSRW